MPHQGKFIASIEARVASSRLPGKVLKEIMGRPLLELMIERIKKSKQIDEIMIATSTNPKDDALEALARRLRVQCYRGSEEDVLSRVLEANLSRKGDDLVELWGDTPLLDPAIIDDAVMYYKNNDFDCVGTKGYPWGMSLLIFPTAILKEVDALTQNPVDRENVSIYIYSHPERYNFVRHEAPKHLTRPELRLTVDELPDFEVVAQVFEHFGPDNIHFDTAAILKFFDEHPDIRNINKDVRQKIYKSGGQGFKLDKHEKI